MNAQSAGGGGGGVSRVSPSGGGTLADVLDKVLDKGIVIDAWAAVSLLGIEILSIQAQVVVASVETYLKYAKAVSAMSLPPAEAKPKQMPHEVKEVKEAKEGKVAAPQRPQAGRPASALPEKGARPGEHVPSEDELIKYLGEHASGVRIDQIAEHFHAPHKQLEESVNHLVDEHRVRRDDARHVFLPMK